MNIRPLCEDQLQLLAADSEGQGTNNQNNWSKNRYKANEVASLDNIPSEFNDVPLDRITINICSIEAHNWNNWHQVAVRVGVMTSHGVVMTSRGFVMPSRGVVMTSRGIEAHNWQ